MDIALLALQSGEAGEAEETQQAPGEVVIIFLLDGRIGGGLGTGGIVLGVGGRGSQRGQRGSGEGGLGAGGKAHCNPPVSYIAQNIRAVPPTGEAEARSE